MDGRTRTRRSPRTVALLLLATVLACTAPGCAPIRRGKLPPVGEQPADRSRDTARSRSRHLAPGGGRPPTGAAPRVDASAPPRERVRELAEGLIGAPYAYGGASPSGFDCSGLVQWVYHEVGIDLPRVTRDQARAGRATSLRMALPGDLVFFRTERNVISHVGIYVGKGEFVHAPGSGKEVRTDSVDDPWWRRRVDSVRRILPDG